MDILQYAREIGEKIEYNYDYKCRVKFKNSIVKVGNTLRECVGEGETKEEALHDYAFRIRGKKVVINHFDHMTRREYNIPLQLKCNER